MGENIRVHALIRGRVQGVFFRKETQKQAVIRNVRGWVKNRADGSVEAVFEGNRQDVSDLLRWCEQGPPAADVTHVQATEVDYTGEFAGFTIAY
ncbi:MAG: acylphosphatase [Thermodesulfobacteriota bacterium]